MSQPLQTNTSLSRSARLLCYLGPPSAILLTYKLSPSAGLLSPFAFLPTALLFRQWREANRKNPLCHGELEPMLWTSVGVATIGISIGALLQLGLCKATSSLLFGSGEASKVFWGEFQRNTIDGLTAHELSCRVELAKSWRNWVFNGVFSYVAAGLVEETLKYLPVIYAAHRGTPEGREPRNRAYIDYALAGALGFSLVEGLGFIYASCQADHGGMSIKLLTLFERVVLGTVGHLSYACLTALRATRRDYYGEKLSWWQVIGPSVLLHGTWNMAAMSISALEGNVGWIHPTGVWATVAVIGPAISIATATVLKVLREWSELDALDAIEKNQKDDSP